MRALFSATRTIACVMTSAEYTVAWIDLFYVNDINRQLSASSQTFLGVNPNAAQGGDGNQHAAGLCRDVLR